MEKNKFTYDKDTYDTVEETRFIQTSFVIRTVTTLFWQFLFTFGMISITVYNEIFNHYITTYMEQLLLTGIFGSIIMTFYIRFISPKTILQLSLFTVFETMCLCVVSALQEPEVIMMAIVSTFGLTMGLGIYAMTTKYNYTNLMSGLLSGLMCLIFMGISNIWLESEFIKSVEPYIGTVLFLGYIIVDVQYFFRKRVSESVYNINDLHIMAAINIYLDVINIFLELVKLYSNNKHDDKRYNKKKHGWW